MLKPENDIYIFYDLDIFLSFLFGEDDHGSNSADDHDADLCYKHILWDHDYTIA